MTKKIPASAVAFGGALGIAVIMGVPRLRRRWITRWILRQAQRHHLIPKMSETEKAALEAGDVWIEREFFSGKPDLRRIASEPLPRLSRQEREFLDGPVEKLCQMVEDWKIWRQRDLPAAAWAYIKKARFWGIIIPEEYGGLGFSSFAHSEVIQKLSSRSLPLSITVMVPNSLGPAELLLRYGTPEQKRYYLPRLARGEDVPCFALTEPKAGSDAAAIRSRGTVFKGEDGKLYLRLDWNKRWITLAAVSSVLGIAFRLRDPENHLGKGEDVGITCALIPTRTPGVVVNRRHDPLRVPFYNSPTHGTNVVVPIDSIIGGPEQAGNGWRMLMECLAAGRGISLPAQATGGAKYVSRVASAHAVVRKQFSASIGKFEGIDEALARIVGFTYLLESARRAVCGAIDQGIRPPIVTAIAKYHSTELGRKVINDGMDIAGGMGITLGPRNLLAHGYMATPIGITVEGANILTRTLIIFGQGVIRAHPYVLAEMSAVARDDLIAFDEAFWGHIRSFGRNFWRSIALSLTRGEFAAAPFEGRREATTRYWQKLSWASATFAFLTDLHLAALGGRLKTMETTSGRFADALSWMILISSVLRRYEADGALEEDAPLLQWCADFGFARIQEAFDGLYANTSIPALSPLLRALTARYSAVNRLGSPPRDLLSFKIALLAQTPGDQRDRRITGGIFASSQSEDPTHRLEHAFRLVHQTEPARRKIKSAIKEGRIAKPESLSQAIAESTDKGVLTPAEAEALRAAEEARDEAIQVDDFSFDEYFGRTGSHRRAA